MACILCVFRNSTYLMERKESDIDRKGYLESASAVVALFISFEPARGNRSSRTRWSSSRRYARPSCLPATCTVFHTAVIWSTIATKVSAYGSMSLTLSAALMFMFLASTFTDFETHFARCGTAFDFLVQASKEIENTRGASFCLRPASADFKDRKASTKCVHI